jgi:hypothetical protein
MQPFATLIAIGEKHFETRCWPTKYRGDLLIHAGKGKNYLFLCEGEPFKSVLAKHGYNKNNLPIGEIIAKVNLTNCIKIDGIQTMFDVSNKKQNINETNFGDWDIGRYAWRLENIESLKEPIPVKGQQRLWNYDFKEDK